MNTTTNEQASAIDGTVHDTFNPAHKVFKYRIGMFEGWKGKFVAAQTADEAESLLYVGTKIWPFHDPFCPAAECIKSTEILKWVTFYLDAGQNVDVGIARTAQRLVVKHWLSRLDYRKMMLPGYLESARRVLRFLTHPQSALYDPPFPRFVAEWLTALFGECKCSSVPNILGGEVAHNALCGDKEIKQLLVLALCAWGQARVLVRDGTCPDALTCDYIDEFLRGKEYSAANALLGAFGIGKPPSTLGTREADYSILLDAALVSLQLQMKNTGRLVLNLNGNDDDNGV